MESLPDELILQICNNLSLRELLNMSLSETRNSKLCQELLNEKKKIFEDAWERIKYGVIDRKSVVGLDNYDDDTTPYIHYITFTYRDNKWIDVALEVDIEIKDDTWPFDKYKPKYKTYIKDEETGDLISSDEYGLFTYEQRTKIPIGDLKNAIIDLLDKNYKLSSWMDDEIIM